MLHAIRRAALVGLGALLAAPFLAAPLAPPAYAAQGDVPVVLPATQRADEWAEALAARGLVATKGLPPPGPSVVITDKGDYWSVVVRDRTGGMQTVNVAPATSAAERDDLLFYLGTLLGPAPSAGPAVATAPVPVPVGPAPVAVGPAPVLVGPAPEGAGGATSATASTSGGATSTTASSPAAGGGSTSPAASGGTSTSAGANTTSSKSPARTSPTGEPRLTTGASAGSAAAVSNGTTGLWVGAGGGVGIRPEAGAVGDFRVDGGWHVTPSIRVGAGLAARTNAALDDAGRAMSDVDVVAEGAWVADMRVAPVVGLYGGVSSRSFTEGGTSVADAVIPILGAEVGAQIPLGSLPIHLEPSVRVQGDLREVQLLSDRQTRTLSPVEVRAGLVIGYRAR